MTRFKSVLPLLCVLLFGGFSPSGFDPSVESPKLLRRDAEWAQASSEG
jgi:hypothetical protein